MVTSAAALASCGRIGFDALRRDSGNLPDAARLVDAGALDASLGDASVVDAGSVDAGTTSDGGAEPDAGACAETPCRLLLAQCGCPASQMCGWNTTTPRRCVPIGTPAPGTTCGSDYDCVPGAGCIELGSGRGQCLAWCESAAGCGPGLQCVRLWWSGPVGVCSVVCDPITNAGCPAPLACSIGLGTDVTSGSDVIETLCGNLGAGGVDAPCSGPLDCQSTLACLGTVCKPVCRMDVPASCTGTCVPFAPRAVIGGVEYGGCV